MRSFHNLLMAVGATILCGCSSGTDNGSNSATTTADSLNNEVIETIMARRSIRVYKPQAVEQEKLKRLVECGVYAPNGMALESWEVRVVEDPKFIARMDSLYQDYSKKNGMPERHATYGAPVIMFVAYDKNYSLSQVDCGLFGGNVMLAAQSLGLGTCCLGGICRFLTLPEASELYKQLELPDTHNLLFAIAIGYPDQAPEAKPRNMNKIKWIK